MDAKAENDALRGDVAAGRRRLHIKAVCQSVREATNSPPRKHFLPRLADTAERGLFHPQREADHYRQKQLEGTQKYINGAVDRVAHIVGNSCNYCEHIHTRFQRSINA